MTRKAIPILRVSRKEVSAALRGEPHGRVRTRLLALRALLDGRTLPAAARAAKTTMGSVERWIHSAQQKRLPALLRPSAYARRRNAMAAEHTTRVRAEIAATLARCPHGRLHSRLRAIDAFLAGQPATEAALIAQVGQSSLLGWLRLIRSVGITGALARWQAPRECHHPQLRADPARLRALAGGEKNPGIRKRILAVACLAEGMSVYDAAVAARLSEHTVYGAMRRFEREGVAAFRNKPSPGGRVWLTSDQLDAVAQHVRADPGMSLDDLRNRILTEFGVRYTQAGLKNMLRKQLGVVRGAAAAWSIVQAHPAPGET